MDFLTLLLRSPASIIEAVFLGCLFYVAVARQERIVRMGRFKIACAVFGFELVVPAFLSLYFHLSTPAGANRPFPDDQLVSMSVWLTVVTPTLLALSFWLAIGSVLPSRQTPV